MSKVSKLCEFSPAEREKIKARDGGCIFCQMFGYSGFPATQIMHYVPRSHLGLGIEKNGAWGCVKHHQELDNGTNSEPMRRVFREYLEQHYDGWSASDCIYSKWDFLKGVEDE